MIDYKLIGSRIKALREISNQTQEVLAEKVDITTVYLSKIENGKVQPTLKTLDAICVALGHTLEDILLNSTTESGQYQNERIVQLFNACSPEVKPIALDLIEHLSKLH